MDTKQNIKKLQTALRDSIADNSFIKLTLSSPTDKSDSLKNIYVRKIQIKREDRLSLTYHHKTRDLVKNFDIEDGIERLIELLKSDFQVALLATTKFDLSWQNNKIRSTPPSQTTQISTDHNRRKNHPVTPEGKAYLHELNITDAQGQVLKTAQDKYRQINKFIEIIGSLLPALPKRETINVVDMGAGKGYLTFALYDYLIEKGLQVQATGVEFRPDLVTLCNQIAKNCQFEHLRFVQGTIDSYKNESANILIALHACDTATDDAIASGIKSGADLIIVSPCCHKQIRREIEATDQKNQLDLMTRHGIFLERHAEMVTDSIRAQIMEYFGYKTKVIEFISDSHTAKNVMIIGVRSGKDSGKNQTILKKINEFKNWLGIQYHYLEQATGLTIAKK